MLSGGIDSPVAGYLAMKRGIKIECVYFESPPHTSVMAKNKVKKLVEELTKYDSSITLNVVKFTALQEAIYKNIDPTYMITIMRRMMYRISEKIMEKTSCLCLINGESVGQVASQTLTSMRVINSVTNVPVIRPVACLDKLEIIDISRKIGTYETSILPYKIVVLFSYLNILLLILIWIKLYYMKRVLILSLLLMKLLIVEK